MAKFFKLLILIPIAIIVIAFAIANRQMVSVSFDPFSAPDVVTGFVAAPLFILLFLALFVGIVLGGVATWFTQGGNRRRARDARDDAERWQAEARRLREAPPVVVGPSPMPAGRALARSDYA